MTGKALALLLAVFGLWAALVYWNHFTVSGQIDGCIDAGGRWNHEQGKCEGIQTSP